MTKEEKKELNDLLNYVKINILGYGEDKKLPPLLKKKINELALNNNKEFIYTYKMILYSFMINKSKIDYAFSTKTFENERHKINYMMVIVSNSMNYIKAKVDSLQRENDKNKMSLDIAQYLNDNNVLLGSGRYVRKSEELNSKKVEELW